MRWAGRGGGCGLVSLGIASVFRHSRGGGIKVAARHSGRRRTHVAANTPGAGRGAVSEWVRGGTMVRAAAWRAWRGVARRGGACRVGGAGRGGARGR